MDLDHNKGQSGEEQLWLEEAARPLSLSDLPTGDSDSVEAGDTLTQPPTPTQATTASCSHFFS